MALTQPQQEAKWKAESDANTIAQAAVIRADPKRLKAASQAAKRLEKEAQVQADALSSVADGKWPLDYDKGLEKNNANTKSKRI